jgi:hypothetical protein
LIHLFNDALSTEILCRVVKGRTIYKCIEKDVEASGRG